jgi:hypothetical protein
MRLLPEHAEEKNVISIITPAVISSAVENHFNITSIAEVDIYVKFLSGTSEIIEHHEVIADLSAEEGPDWQFQWAKENPKARFHDDIPFDQGK